LVWPHQTGKRVTAAFIHLRGKFVRIDPLLVHRPLLFAFALIGTIVIDAIISFLMFYRYMLEQA